MLFKVLPDIDIPWKDVWLGAFVTALMFTFGHFLLKFYISKLRIGLAFGASAAVIIILIWVYYSAQIFFIGATITKIFASNYQRK